MGGVGPLGFHGPKQQVAHSTCAHVLLERASLMSSFLPQLLRNLGDRACQRSQRKREGSQKPLVAPCLPGSLYIKAHSTCVQAAAPDKLGRKPVGFITVNLEPSWGQACGAVPATTFS